jgi:hypothetical protein
MLERNRSRSGDDHEAAGGHTTKLPSKHSDYSISSQCKPVIALIAIHSTQIESADRAGEVLCRSFPLSFDVLTGHCDTSGMQEEHGNSFQKGNCVFISMVELVACSISTSEVSIFSHQMRRVFRDQCPRMGHRSLCSGI